MTAPRSPRPASTLLLPTGPVVSAIRSLLETHSTTHLAATLSLDRRTLQRLSTRPYIRRDAADRLAVALGRHPSEIWVEWFDPVET
jgi:lambda repressor-like predicted transcriptional regulator